MYKSVWNVITLGWPLLRSWHLYFMFRLYANTDWFYINGIISYFLCTSLKCLMLSFFLLPPLCKCSYHFFHSSYHSLRIVFCGYFFLSLSLTAELPKNENASIHVPTTSLQLKRYEDSWYLLLILSPGAPAIHVLTTILIWCLSFTGMNL